MARGTTSVIATGFLLLWSLLLLNLAGREASPERLSLEQLVSFERFQINAPQRNQRRLLAKLEQPVQLEFVDAKLTDIADYLSQQHEIDLIVDLQSFEYSDFDLQRPLSARLPQVPLRSALTLLLQPHGLTWSTRAGQVRMSCPSGAWLSNDSQVYAVDRLLQSPHDSQQLDVNDLIDAMTTVVAPTTWEEAGGAGSAMSFGNTLVVNQDSIVLTEIEHFLGGLEQIANDYDRDPQSIVNNSYRWTDTMSEDTYDRLQAALKEPVPSMQFSDTPLEAIIDWLARHTSAPLYLETKAANKAAPNNVPPTRPRMVSLTTQGESLAEVLTTVLAPFDMTFSFRHDCIYLANANDNSVSIGRMYAVRDLVEIDSSEEELFWKYHSLASPLEYLISDSLPDLDFAYVDSIDVLVVLAPLEAQRKLQGLLTKLRTARGPIDLQEHARKLSKARQGPVSLIYRTLDIVSDDELVPMIPLAKLRDMLTSKLPAELSQRVQIECLPDSMRIRATPAEHRELQSIIERTGLPLLQLKAKAAGCLLQSIIPVVG